MKRSISFYLVLMVLVIQPSPLIADEIKINGFIAQGIIQANDSNFVTDDGKVTSELTELGINSSYRINSQFRVAGQVVYLDGGNRYAQGLRLDYLFLEWQLHNSPDWQVKTQIGRNKNYHWLYSSTRDVPHTRPSIVLPQSLYFDVFRDVALGVDGISIVAQKNTKMGELDFNFSFGNSEISEQQESNLLGDLAAGKLKLDLDKQFSVFWRPNATNFQFGLALLDADFTYQQGETDIFTSGSVTTQRLMLNLLYQGQSWEVASEILREKVVVENIILSGFNSDITAEGGYAQARYFVSEELTLLARLDLFDLNRESRDGRFIEIASQGMVPGYFAFMDQATAGITWKFSNNMQLQAELHRVKGTGRLAPVFTPDLIANDSKYWNMWAVQLMYWF